MARPRKSGIEYFPFDTDFFLDKKIRILKSRFGADGIAIYIYLLCEIYRNGYYIRIDDDYEYIIADDLGMSNEKVKQVMKFLLERSLLDSTLFQSDTIITSLGIQRRFQEAVKGRASKSEIEVEERFWLLSEKDTQPFIKCTHNPSYSEKNPSYSEKNPSYSEKNNTKESKEKESKEKESIITVSKDTVCQTQDVRRIVDAWNELEAYGIKTISRLSSGSQRYQRLSARIRQYGVDEVLNAIDKIKISDFLQGKNNKGWTITFDWFVLPNNFLKVLDGNYDNRCNKQQYNSQTAQMLENSYDMMAEWALGKKMEEYGYDS